MGSYWPKVWFYVIVFVYAVFMSASGYPPLLTVGSVVAAIIINLSLTFYYPMFAEKRVDRLEKFLLKQKRIPAIYINYVLANRLDEEAEVLMEQLLRKYKRPAVQAQFVAAYGAYRNDTDAVRKAVPLIRMQDYRAYYEAFLFIEDGRADQARTMIESIKKPSMRFALLAELDRKEWRHESAVMHAREAFRASRGVQRYVLYKEYERTLPQALESVS